MDMFKWNDLKKKERKKERKKRLNNEQCTKITQEYERMKYHF